MKIKICIATMMMILSMGVMAQDSNVARIKDLVNLGHYEQALIELDKTQAEKGQLELKKLRALSHLELEKYAIAEILYLSISLQDNGVDVSNNLGLAYLRQLKFVEAIQTFQNTIRRFPEDAAAYKNLGDAYLFLAQSTYKKGAEAVGNVDERQREDVSESLGINSATESQTMITDATSEFEGDSEKLLESHFEPNTEDEYVSEQSEAMEAAHGVRISRFLETWAQAKSGNGLEEFYEYYDSRELAIVSPQNPEDGVVRALEPSVQFISNDQANVVFDEWTGPYSKRTRLFKQLSLALVDSEWKITGEKVIHVY